MLINTYSASKLKLYQQCRAMYYDRYVLGKKETKGDTSSIFGSALHNAIEYKYAKGYDPIARFTRYVNLIYARRLKYTDISHSMSYNGMFIEGRGILAGFPWDAYHPIQNEIGFTVPFYYQGTIIAMLHGYIDMITDDNMVIDFKSSKYKPSQNKLNNDIQFAVYWYAVKQLEHIAPNKVIWHHLRDNTILEYDTTNVQDRLDEIGQLIMTIEQDDFEDVEEGKICERCAPWCMRC